MGQHRIAVVISPKMLSDGLRFVLSDKHILVEPESSPEVTIISAAELSNGSLQGRKILLVKDDPVPPLFELIRAQAFGVVMSNEFGLPDLLNAIEAVANGSVAMTCTTLEESANSAVKNAALTDVELTGRRWEVAECLAERLGNKEIAKRLGISVDTVKNHVGAVLRAFGVDSRHRVAEVIRNRQTRSV